MAENDTGQERTEQPTPKRLEDARKKGQVLRSRELNTMISMLGVSIAVFTLGASLGSDLMALVNRLMRIERRLAFDDGLMFVHLREAVTDAIMLQVPLFAALAAAAFFGPMFVGGIRFSVEALGPKVEHLDPIKGLKRLFGPNALIELVKALLKVLWLGAVAAVVGYGMRHDLLSLASLSADQAVLVSVEHITFALVTLSIALLPIAAIDLPHQVWQHFSKLRMTRQEVKDELKETDGNPEMKGRLRQQQREMAQRRMMEEVPHADVVVTNPTHFAVALRYDPRGTGAPEVVAKGADHVARRIRQVAAANDVPLFEAPPLARALYWSSEIGSAIPPALYVAVARVLAYVYQLRAAAPGYHAPVAPTDLPVPDDLARGNAP